MRYIFIFFLNIYYLSFTSAHAQEVITQPRLMLYAGSLYKDFIGCLNCDQYNFSSVWNNYSPYGWDNTYTKYSHFYTYRQEHGVYSACDPYATHPPRIVDKENKIYGYLNISKTRHDSVCYPNAMKVVCEKLTEICDHEKPFS